MRKACPRCKSLDTKVLSPNRMSCKNCRNVWVHSSRSYGAGSKPQFFRGELILSKSKGKKIHKA